MNERDIRRLAGERLSEIDDLVVALRREFTEGAITSIYVDERVAAIERAAYAVASYAVTVERSRR
jgi:hypothetical protein